MGGHRRPFSEGRCAERRADEIRRRELAKKRCVKPETGARHEVETSKPGPQTDRSGSLKSAA
jgi:hypothetical protein